MKQKRSKRNRSLMTGILLLAVLAAGITGIWIQEQSYGEVIQLDPQNRKILVQKNKDMMWFLINENTEMTNRWGEQTAFESFAVGSRVKAVKGSYIMLSAPPQTFAQSVTLMKK